MSTPSAAQPDETIRMQTPPLPPWTMYTVTVTLLCGYILVPLLLSNAILLLHPFMSEANQLFVQQSVTLLTWLCIFAGLQWKYGHLPQYLGLQRTRPWKYYIWEALQLVLLTLGMTLLLNSLWSHPGLQHAEEIPYQHYGRQQLLMLSFFAVLMAPVLEELIFRGLVQSTFHKISTPVRSVLFTTLVFLSLHGSYFNNMKALTHVMALGLCFGIWRERTQSLIPGMVAHLLNNTLASVVLLNYVAH